MDYFGHVQAAADAVRARVGALPTTAIVLGSGLGDFAGSWPAATSIAYSELPNWPVSSVPGHEGRLVIGTHAGPPGGRAGRALSSLRGLRRPDGDVRHPRPRAARREAADSDQRRRRREHDVLAGRADGHRRPHQPDRAQPARRAQRRSIRPALSGHVGRIFFTAARAGRRGGEGRRRRAGARRLRRAARAELRDAGGDPLPEGHRRRRRRHVHGARSDRGAAHGHRRAGHLVHHEHGRGRAAAAARSRRGHGDTARRVRGQFIALLEGIIGRLA